MLERAQQHAAQQDLGFYDLRLSFLDNATTVRLDWEPELQLLCQVVIQHVN